MSSKKSLRNLLSVSLSKGAPGAGSGASNRGSWLPSTESRERQGQHDSFKSYNSRRLGANAHPKGIWKGSESGCDEPILLGGCRTASMGAPLEERWKPGEAAMLCAGLGLGEEE